MKKFIARLAAAVAAIVLIVVAGAAGATADTGVNIIAPTSGATVSGTVNVQVTAAEWTQTATVQVFFDNAQVGGDLVQVPFIYPLDTTTLPNGSHIITATARTTSGQTIVANASVAVIVQNTPPLSIDTLSAGSVGPTWAVINVATSRPTAVLLAYGPNYDYTTTISPSLQKTVMHTFTLAALQPASVYSVRAQATDANYNNAYRADLTFTTGAAPTGFTTPTVQITAPANNAYVAATMTVAVAVTDVLPANAPAGTQNTIAGVTYQIDGEDVTDFVSAAPFSGSVDTTKAPNGSHQLTAVVRDNNGYSNRSPGVSIIVQNGTFSINPAPTPAPTPNPSPTPVNFNPLNVRLINATGTFYLISNNYRFGITDPGVLAGYGFQFKDAHAAAAADLNLPLANRLVPAEGTLVKKVSDPTVWLVSSGQKYGFTSAAVFTGQGFAWRNVLTVAAEVLDPLAVGGTISDAAARHLRGAWINDSGTIYWMDRDSRHGVASLDIYNSWNLPGDFSHVVPANAADRAVTVGSAEPARVIQ